MSLTPRVDGVIIVSRAGRATAKQAHEIRAVLDRVQAPIVGLVITGVKSRNVPGYGRDYYQNQG